MKRLILVGVATTLLATTASAAGMGGLGFRSLNGPGATLPNTGLGFSASPAIGMRHWLNERTGVDAAVGFASVSTDAGDPAVDLDGGTGFVVDIGVPISAKKWDKVNVIFRPGLTWGSATAEDKTSTTPPNEVETKLMTFSGELEVEYMLADKLSISAAHGIAWQSLELENNATPTPARQKASGFQSTGDNFTTLGFHVYLWGAGSQ